MVRLALAVSGGLVLAASLAAPAFAFTTPFTFHCTDKVAHVLPPGETKAPPSEVQCYGYTDGGETANFVRGPAR